MIDEDRPYSSSLHDPVTGVGELQTSVVLQPENPWRLDTEFEVENPLFGSKELPELGHFEVLETIGRGGFGVVVKAFDQKLQRIVAIKMMSAQMAVNSPARKRFVREARAGAAVRSENVVRIYAVEEKPTPYLVMEYVPGISLQQHLNRVGPLEVAEVLRIGSQIARGLAAAHATGLVHRDIKPANVLLEDGANTTVKLTDFGLARAADDASLSQSGMVVGTPMFMAPEQARGDTFDHRADLYSLGSVLYVMVTGRPPFRASSVLSVLKRVVEEQPRPIQEIIPETPQWLCDIISKLHEKKPELRFGSAEEVAVVLEKCLKDMQQGIPIQAPVPHKPSRSNARYAIAEMAATGFLGCVALLAWMFGFLPVGPIARPIQPVATIAPIPLPVEAVVKPVAAIENTYTNSLGIEFVRVPAGTSKLGGEKGIAGKNEVTVPYDYFIGKYELTREQWEKVIGPGTDPSHFSRTNAGRSEVETVSDDDLKRYPVERVSWNDCQEYIRQLNRKTQEKGWTYRLPTFTEWAYACRNGPGQSDADLGCEYYSGEPSMTWTPEMGNLKETGLKSTTRVGSYKPNRLGIYDMHGNVHECLDDMYGAGRLIAGSSYDIPAAQWKIRECRAVFSLEFRSDAGGLRLVRVPVCEATITPRQHLESVVAELVRLNPGFSGKVETAVDTDGVVGLTIPNAEQIKTISPLRELRHLRTLRIYGGQFSDLSPLIGLPLRNLEINGNFKISDINSLKGMPLEILSIWGFRGNDILPLKGMKLKSLNIGGGEVKLDLEALRGQPLNFLCLNLTKIDDLSPLKGMPIDDLLLTGTEVRDLSPLIGMPMRVLKINGTKVTDTNPICKMPLKHLELDYQHDRDAELLKAIPSLEMINLKKADEFWKEQNEKEKNKK